MSDTKAEAVPVETWACWLHPIFPRCLGDCGRLYDLSRPFVIEEYVYAADARIMVRMPTPELWTIPNGGKLPRPGDVIAIFGRDDWSRYPWRAEPTQFPPVEGACKVCEGRKVLPEVDCPWCGGLSRLRYEGSSDFCVECYQLEGRIPAGPCHECGGTGVLDASRRIEVVPGYWLMRKYVALLHEFEMTTYLPVELGDGGHCLTRFTQGDVTGVLMPMTAPKEGDR